ncbi:MAG: hypothetical protein AABX73_01940 [Nanoarchaeota archaeon]
MINKRGELTSSQIIVIIAAIAGFVIILFFLLNILDLGNYGEDEICHLSVISRATAKETAQQLVPLQCSTKKNCLTSNSKECKEFLGENSEKITLQKNPEKAAEQIEKTIAESMYECWRTMGEGKISIFSKASEQYGITPDELTCVICKRIALNLEETEKNNILEKVNINEYIKNTQTPDSSLTYLEAFTDKGIKSPVLQTEEITEEWNKLKNSGSEIIEFKSNTNELAVVFAQIKPPSYESTLSSIVFLGGTAAGAAFLSPFKKALLHPAGFVMVVAGAAGITLISMSNVNEGKTTSIGYCGKFTTNNEKASEGCSSILVLPYERATINKICTNIEGLQ